MNFSIKKRKCRKERRKEGRKEGRKKGKEERQKKEMKYRRKEERRTEGNGVKERKEIMYSFSNLMKGKNMVLYYIFLCT